MSKSKKRYTIFTRIRDFFRKKCPNCKELNEFIDFCTEYTFDNFADIIRFNERFNEVPFFLEIDYTYELIDNVENTILLDSNSIFMLYGTRNMGKSEFAGKIGKIIQEKNLELKKRETELRTLFDYQNMREIFRIMKSGDPTIRDDFIFCNPTLIMRDDVDYYIEMAGKKIVHECNCGEKVLNAQKRRIKKCPLCGCNLDYEKDLCLEECRNRAILYDREHEILGFIYLGLHDDEEFRQDYKEREKKNIISVMAKKTKRLS